MLKGRSRVECRLSHRNADSLTGFGNLCTLPAIRLERQCYGGQGIAATTDFLPVNGFKFARPIASPQAA